MPPPGRADTSFGTGVGQSGRGPPARWARTHPFSSPKLSVVVLPCTSKAQLAAVLAAFMSVGGMAYVSAETCRMAMELVVPRLAPDERGRAACLCRAARDVVRDPRFWGRRSNGECGWLLQLCHCTARVSSDALRELLHRSRKFLVELDIGGPACDSLTIDAVLHALSVGGGCPRLLRLLLACARVGRDVTGALPASRLRELTAACPALDYAAVGVVADADTAAAAAAAEVLRAPVTLFVNAAIAGVDGQVRLPPSVTALDLARDITGEARLRALCAAALASGTLTELRVGVLLDGAAAALAGILRANCALAELSIGSMPRVNAGPGGLIGVFNSLRGNTRLASLSLNLDDAIANWHQADFAGLWAALSDTLGVNPALAALRLDNSVLLGGAAFVNALCANTALEKLSIPLSHVTGAELGAILRRNSTLTALDLRGGCALHVGLRLVGAALGANTSLKHLDVSSCYFGRYASVEAVVQLGLGLRHNTALTRLTLSCNCIEDRGVASLTDALQSNRSLTELLLDGNSIGNDGAQALSRLLRLRSTPLVTLGLARNRIGADGAMRLAQALRVNRRLAVLNLSGNCTGDAGAHAFVDPMVENTALGMVSLGWNDLSEGCPSQLEHALERRGGAECAAKVCFRLVTDTATIRARRPNFGRSFAHEIE